jgi:uncharacterized protein (UPF0303 family)
MKYNKYTKQQKKNLRYLEQREKKLQQKNFEEADDKKAENIIKGFLTNQKPLNLDIEDWQNNHNKAWLGNDRNV